MFTFNYILHISSNFCEDWDKTIMEAMAYPTSFPTLTPSYIMKGHASKSVETWSTCLMPKIYPHPTTSPK